MLGRWTADGVRSAESFARNVRALTPEQQSRLAEEFGKMYYDITTRHFTVGGWVEGDAITTPYRVVSESESSITLSFPDNRRFPDLTLFRENQDSMFIRSIGKNFEYLKRSASGAA
jgi:hypothetical protein